MKRVFKGLSYLGLALTVFPSLLVFQNVISLELHKTLMLTGTLLWFATAAQSMKGDPSG